MRTTLTAALAASALLLPAAALASTDESQPTTGSYISISKGKASIKKLTKRVADRDGAASYLVFNCSHPGRNAALVKCTARLRFRDVDGTVGYTRYTGTATATRTTLTPR